MRAATTKLPAVLMVVAIAISGCGGDDGGDGGTTAASGTQAGGTIDVSLTDFKIDPPNPRIAQAGQVKFQVKNDGDTQHNLEVEGPNGETELPSNLDPGQTGTLTVDLSSPGTYEWYCPVGNHRDLGMRGQVTVGGEGGDGGTGTGTDTTDSGSPSPY